ncbi:MAG: MFS transporter [Chloroflexi bacterium]|nr:MFS transporter [Chloroflexota bacterium]MXZ45489.1 MFS transporter [Chloroflexota bacterium]
MRPPAERDYSYKWTAFIAIGISFVTQVLAQSMVFVALSDIADDFGVTLRAVSWVVVIQALTISAFMMPMGRLADIIGWRKVHLIGLVVFGGGAMCVALAPTFGLLIAARVLMAAGNSMGQSVGTAMAVAVFPPEERGTAIGSQTTAVAIGGASGPMVGGLVLQVLPWEALFWMVQIPIAIAFISGYFLLTEERLGQPRDAERPPFDYLGATISVIAISIFVVVVNNPLAMSWTSPLLLGGFAAVAVLFAGFVPWELRHRAPMVELRMFADRVFSMASLARFLGFLGATVTILMAPIYLISLRGMDTAAAGAVLFLGFVGMGVAAQATGRLSDRFGPRRFALGGYVIMMTTALSFSFLTSATPLWLVAPLLLVNGVGMGTWNVPNNTMIIGAVPVSRLGVVGALTNLTRNVGNVVGQAVAAGVVVAVMAGQGFDIPLSEVRETAGASAAFFDGWQAAYWMAAFFMGIALLCTVFAPGGRRGSRER